MPSPNGCPLALADDPIGWCSGHGCYVDHCPPVADRARCEKCVHDNHAGCMDGAGDYTCCCADREREEYDPEERDYDPDEDRTP